MAYGIQIKDASGNVKIENTDRLTRLLFTKTLDSAKSPGGFRWDDPGNTPDKYLDGTVTKGNFFNPGGLLGKRTV